MTAPTPSSTTTRPPNWSARRAYLCVFVPLLLVIAVVGVVRYRYMLHAEVTAAAEQGRAEASRMGAALFPALQRLPTDDTERARAVLQDSLVYFADTLHTVQWQVQGHSAVTAQKPPGAPVAPGWFEKWVPIDSPELELAETRPDGKSVRLHITLQRHVYVDHVWANVRLQSTISLFNAAFALALAAWLVHRHIRLVRRVLRALQAIRQGHPAAHMTEHMSARGPAAEQAVAEALNETAAQWRQQLAQQQAQLDRQAQQLELAQWMIAATPMPVTVRRSDGVCLDVRQEWLRRFQSPLPEEPQATSLTSRAQPAKDECCTSGLPAGSAAVPSHEAVARLPATPLTAERGSPPNRARGLRAPMGDGVITTDLQGTIETINDTAQYLTGFELHEAIGQPLDAVFRLADALHPQPHEGLCAPDMGTDTAARAHPALVHRSGERCTIEYTATPIRKSNGVAVGCVLTFHEVSEAAQRDPHLPWQAPHDALTGLPTQTALTEQLTHALFSAQAQGHHVAVCMIDLDRFEEVNLQHGSAIADEALREVARRLSAFAGPHDLVARMAGDEFVLLMGQLPDPHTGESRTTALHAALGQPYPLGGHAMRISASIGVAVYPTLPGDPKALLRQADQAMCQAKQAGGHQVQFFAPQGEPSQPAPSPGTQQARIAQALRTGELRLHFQPQVNQSTGQVIALEALLRWEHPEHGLQGPEHVLPLISDADLAAELGEWVLTEALGQLRRWHMQGLHWTVTVNLSAQHLLRSNFTARLSDILALFAPLPAHCLQLEVQESAGLNNPQALQAVMVHCQQTLGVRWAIDDFGIGQATLAWVAQVPADTVKVDGSITAAMLHSTRHAAIVSTALAMAQALGRTLVAEGAESPAHCTRLRELGCHVVQGYAIAHPMPGSEVAEWARSYRRSVAPMLVLP